MTATASATNGFPFASGGRGESDIVSGIFKASDDRPQSPSWPEEASEGPPAPAENLICWT